MIPDPLEELRAAFIATKRKAEEAKAWRIEAWHAMTAATNALEAAEAVAWNAREAYTKAVLEAAEVLEAVG